MAPPCPPRPLLRATAYRVDNGMMSSRGETATTIPQRRTTQQPAPSPASHCSQGGSQVLAADNEGMGNRDARGEGTRREQVTSTQGGRGTGTTMTMTMMRGTGMGTTTTTTTGTQWTKGGGGREQRQWWGQTNHHHHGDVMNKGQGGGNGNDDDAAGGWGQSLPPPWGCNDGQQGVGEGFWFFQVDFIF